MARKMMEPKKKYLGTLEEVVELLVKWKYMGYLLTLDDCSKIMGLSRSAIKAIESRSLAKAKENAKKRFGKDIKLDDFIDLRKNRTMALKSYGNPEAE